LGGSSFTFVTDGIERALDLAQEAAGDREVVLMGASVAQQWLRAGLVDELRIHLVPVLLGDGVLRFDRWSVAGGVDGGGEIGGEGAEAGEA
jgi:dihydrofolate reductase